MARAQRGDRHSDPAGGQPVSGPASLGPPGEQWSPDDLSAVERWAQPLLREAGLHVTRPRLLVLATLRGRERPVTALDLHEELATRLHESEAEGAVPGVTTIYRTLATLADRGVLHSFPQDRAVTAYRLCPPVPHLHLLCRSCGRVQEQSPDNAMEWAAAQVTPGGFTVEDYRGELVGLCAACRPTPTDHPRILHWPDELA